MKKAQFGERQKTSRRPERQSMEKNLKTLNPIELPDGMWERIAQKAYELYKERGGQDGHALDDWLEAETIVMEEIHEARE